MNAYGSAHGQEDAQAPARLTCHSVHSAVVSLLWPHDSANMWQPIQPHPVGIFVQPLWLHLQGTHTGEALLCGDVLGVLLTKNALRELSGCPFLPWAILLRLENRILAYFGSRGKLDQVRLSALL